MYYLYIYLWYYHPAARRSNSLTYHANMTCVFEVCRYLYKLVAFLLVSSILFVLNLSQLLVLKQRYRIYDLHTGEIKSNLFKRFLKAALYPHGGSKLQFRTDMSKAASSVITAINMNLTGYQFQNTLTMLAHIGF